MLLLCIGGHIKSFLRYKFVILDTDNPDTLYLRQQGCNDQRLFFAAEKGVREQKSLGNRGLDTSQNNLLLLPGSEPHSLKSLVLTNFGEDNSLVPLPGPANRIVLPEI